MRLAEAQLGPSLVVYEARNRKRIRESLRRGGWDRIGPILAVSLRNRGDLPTSGGSARTAARLLNCGRHIPPTFNLVLSQRTLPVRTLPVYLTLGVAALLTVACSSNTSPSSTSTTTTTTTSTVSFATIQSTILTPSCEGCHTDVGRTAAGGLNLKAGAEIGRADV